MMQVPLCFILDDVWLIFVALSVRWDHHEHFMIYILLFRLLTVKERSNGLTPLLERMERTILLKYRVVYALAECKVGDNDAFVIASPLTLV